MGFKSLCNALRGIKLDNSLQKSSGPGALLKKDFILLYYPALYFGSYLGTVPVSQYPHVVKARGDTSDMPWCADRLGAAIIFNSYFILISKLQFCLILMPRVLTNTK